MAGDDEDGKKPNTNPWGAPNNNNKNTGKRPTGNTQQPPNLEEIFRKSQDRFKKMSMPNGGGNGLSPKFILFGVACAVALWGVSGFYRVDSDAVGIEMTFGKWTNAANPSPPGLHWNWPSPIGSVERPVVTRENRITVGFETASGNYRSRADRRDVPEESMMLTGDENIVDIDFIVFWRIKDGGNYVFNVAYPEEALKSSAESVMRGVIGERPILDALAERRRDIEQATIIRLQQMMNQYGTGIEIKNVQLLDVSPPEQVVDSFNDVQRARADKEKLRNQADAYRNSVIPQAKGQAQKIAQEAQAYREQIVDKAKGDADRFTKIYNAYKQSEDVTTKRLYLETMEAVLKDTKKVIISDGAKGASGVVPYLPLNDLKK
jgi:membrane protease subunit HflK